MAVTWKIDHEKRTTIIVAEGNVTRAEMDAFLDDTEAAGAMPYRRLFDGTLADTNMGAENILQLGVRMRGYHQTAGTMGPLAVVIPIEKVSMVERVLGMLAVADRPMKVFTAVGPARRWIAKQSLSAPERKRKGRGPGRPRRTSSER